MAITISKEEGFEISKNESAGKGPLTSKPKAFAS